MCDRVTSYIIMCDKIAMYVITDEGIGKLHHYGLEKWEGNEHELVDLNHLDY